MDLASPSILGTIMPLFVILNFIICLALIGLTVHALILAIKALKIYINNNS